MKLSTRLLLPLLAAVAAVMVVYAFWAVRQRVETLTREARAETYIYARTLGLAMEAAFRSAVLTDAQELIDRLSREQTIYGVLVYGGNGRPLLMSEPLAQEDAAAVDSVRRVMSLGEPLDFDREIRGVRVFSVVHPVRDPLGKVIAAFEVTQPLSVLEAEIARTRQRFLLNTATLLVAVTVMTLLLVRRLVARPLARLIAGSRALAEGELGHRVEADPGATELAQLAEEFNSMANRLQVAHGELVREAEERVLLERRLRETEKLAAIGNIAAGIAHEVGAPLHVIRGRAELLMRRPGIGEQEQRNLRIIVEQIERITRIVRNLLDFARRREPRMEMVDAAEVVRGVLEFLDPELERAGIAIDFEAAIPARVRGDASLLDQVFLNLLVNAIQALDGQAGERRIRIRIAPVEGDRVAVDLRDTGPGIAADVRNSLFEPFVTTKASGEGTGLGLAVARSIVAEHDGTLEVLDEAGGAAFRVTLPAARTPEPAHA